MTVGVFNVYTQLVLNDPYKAYLKLTEIDATSIDIGHWSKPSVILFLYCFDYLRSTNFRGY